MILRQNRGLIEKLLMKRETDLATYLYYWFCSDVFNHKDDPHTYGHVLSYLWHVATDLGLNVIEQQISSLNLHNHLLGPQTTLGIEPLELGHAVVHRLQLVAVQLAGEEVLWSHGGWSWIRSAKKGCTVHNVRVSTLVQSGLPQLWRECCPIVCSVFQSTPFSALK